jgi:hypothetical protein
MIAWTLAALLAAGAAVPTVTVRPGKPLYERTSTGLALNCDFVIENPTGEPWLLWEIKVTARDAAGGVLFKRHLGSNGTAPSIETLPRRESAPDKALLVFNPFHTFDTAAVPARLDYEFVLAAPKQGDLREHHLALTVTPELRVQKAQLVLPLKGRVLVWDAHDYYSHHRRLDTTHPAVMSMGWSRNPIRYAYDFSIVDEAGAMYRTKGETREDWYGWSVPVYAPGDGVVTYARNDVVDHQPGKPTLSFEQIKADQRLLAGNQVIIDHGNGEVSLVAHLKHGSLTVKQGDRVTRDQKIAEMGFSGDAFTVHIHYELRAATELQTEGLPSEFTGYRRVLGAKRLAVERGTPETGEIIER